jgi:cytochrome c peroxidase
VRLTILLFAIIGSLIFCGSRTQPPPQTDVQLAAIGHYLFFETRLSRNGTKSCASCHAPELAFTDGYRRSLGAETDVVAHNAPTLLNVANLKVLNWANPTTRSLAAQLQQPFFAAHPPELGLAQSDTIKILAYLRQQPTYQRLFAQAQQPFLWQTVAHSLIAYVTGLRSYNSAFDRLQRGDSSAMTTAARRGAQLFFSQKLNCGVCHPAPDFTLAAVTPDAYANIGLYGCYAAADNGLQEYTKKRRDNGRFRIPSLRNVALTAPYMHDGSVNTLDEALTIFERGGRDFVTTSKSQKQTHNDGKKHPQKSALVRGFALTNRERADVLQFLNSLTDTSFCHQAYFKNPFL